MSNNYHLVTASGCELVSLRVAAQDGTACFYRANGSKVYAKPGEWHEETECPNCHHHDGINSRLVEVAIEIEPKQESTTTGESASESRTEGKTADAAEPAEPPKRGGRGFRRSRA